MTEKERQERRQEVLEAYAGSGSVRGVRRKTGHSRRFIRKVLRGEDRPRRAKLHVPRPSRLDPFKPQLKRLIEEDGLTAVLALEELRQMGFDGSYSVVKQFVRTIRPSPAARATTVVEHPPGEEGQVDWSPYNVLLGGQSVVVHGFSMVLPFSRYMFVRFALDEVLETLLRLHDEGFADIGSVPGRMSYDNMTTVGRHVGPGQVWVNPRFADYAQRYDFDVHLIAPGKPDEHGSVERPFHYIEHNCLLRRRCRFDDLDDLNHHARWWCEAVANVRRHGTTRQRPVDLLRYERSFCKPLPWDRPEVYRVLPRKVATDHCVAVDTNRYSVSPRHVGKPATVHLYDQRLEIFIEGEFHARHDISHERFQRFVLPEHEEEFKRCTSSRRLLEGAFLRLGKGARDYYDGLCAQRGRGAGYHLKRILRLADRHGASVVTAAMAHAARFGSYSAEAVARVIAGRTLHREAPATPAGEAPMPPERVRRWLEGLDVEGRDLDDFDQMVDDAAEGGDHDEE